MRAVRVLCNSGKEPLMVGMVLQQANLARVFLGALSLPRGLHVVGIQLQPC